MEAPHRARQRSTGSMPPAEHSVGAHIAARPDGPSVFALLKASAVPLLTVFQLLELAVCHVIQRSRKCLPHWVQRAINGISSGHPAVDASALVWVIGVCVALEFGVRAAWLQVSVGVAAFLLSQLPWCQRASSPAEIDPSIKAHGRLSPTAALCIEMAVAAAVAYSVVTSPTGHAWGWAAASLSLALFAALRLLALTHFPHQLAVSLVFGFGLCSLLDAAVAAFLPPKTRISADVHAVGGVVVLCCAVAYVAALAESNDAPMLRVERKEYERMLRHLARTSEAARAEQRRQALQQLSSRLSGDRFSLGAAATTTASPASASGGRRRASQLGLAAPSGSPDGSGGYLPRGAEQQLLGEALALAAATNGSSRGRTPGGEGGGGTGHAAPVIREHERGARRQADAGSASDDEDTGSASADDREAAHDDDGDAQWEDDATPVGTHAYAFDRER